MFQLGVVSIINKPTRVTSSSVTAIDNILTNSFFDLSLKTGIIKTDISDHFPIYFSIKTVFLNEKSPSIKCYKRIINDRRINEFKVKLSILNWDDVIDEANPNFAYNTFLDKFLKIYDEIFPIKEYEITGKSLKSPWITSALKKSSKHKQKLYVKYLKKRTENNLSTYKRLCTSI